MLLKDLTIIIARYKPILCVQTINNMLSISFLTHWVNIEWLCNLLEDFIENDRKDVTKNTDLWCLSELTQVVEWCGVSCGSQVSRGDVTMLKDLCFIKENEFLFVNV